MYFVPDSFYKTEIKQKTLDIGFCAAFTNTPSTDIPLQLCKP